MNIAFTVDSIMILKVSLSTFLGCLIGWEREVHGCDAGLRTYASVTLGACIFGIVSIYAGQNADPGRIAAQVVTGIGFLCAGVIMRRERGKISGLTTAAALWTSAAIGLVVAYGLYSLAVICTLLLVTILIAHRLSTKIHQNRNKEGRDEEPDQQKKN